MKVYTVITVASSQDEKSNALDVSKTAHSTREAATKGLEDYEEVQTNLFQKTDESNGLTFTVLIVEQEVV
jgi:hypothetical protein